MANQIQVLGNSMVATVLAWGTAAIGIALAASAVLWVYRIIKATKFLCAGERPFGRVRRRDPTALSPAPLLGGLGGVSQTPPPHLLR